MKGTITAWLRTGITALEGDIVTASMIYTRPPRQLTAKQAKRMRELRRRNRAKYSNRFKGAEVKVLVGHKIVHGFLGLVCIPISFTGAPPPTKGT